MQDRIKQMAEEAGAAFDDTFESVGSNPMYLLTPDELERFAQAIARECAEICRDLANTDAHDYNDVRNECGNAIRARFGIKE